MNRIRTFATAATLAAMAFAAPASAQTFSFEFDRWMLATAEGRVAVLNSLERRIDNFCRVSDAKGALQRTIAADCQRHTIAQALQQIDDTRVVALYEERQREALSRA